MKPAPGRTNPLGHRFVVGVLRPLARRVMKFDFRGSEHLPPTGGYIVCANHISNVDFLSFGVFLVDHDVPVKFLAKSSLFDVPIVGRVIGGAGQIPVYRGTSHAVDSLKAAKDALASGEVIGIYPEGTLTADPDNWPMRAKTGAGRLALATRVPVIPVAQWGAQDVPGRFAKFPWKLRRSPVVVKAAEPVDLSDLYDKSDEPGAAREATDRIMARIRTILADIRGEAAPDHVWDRRTDVTEEFAAREAHIKDVASKQIAARTARGRRFGWARRR